MDEQERPDPLGDVINLLAAPIAGGLRSIEHARRGVEELFRAIDNLNRTMENLNEAAERVNRFMADVEEPVRAMLPQIARTVRAADDLMKLVDPPARRVAPSIGRIADTLGSPAFTGLPHQLEEFMTVMSDMSRRLAPLTQFAETAGGMFGLRLPGTSRPAGEPTPTPPPRAAPPVAESDGRRAARKGAAPAKKAARKRSTANAPSKRGAARG